MVKYRITNKPIHNHKSLFISQSAWSSFHTVNFERLQLLAQAISLFEKCPSERLHARKCVGFILHDNSDYDGAEWPIMTEQRVLKDSTNEIKHFRENPLVQKALKEAEDYLDIKCGKNSNN